MKETSHKKTLKLRAKMFGEFYKIDRREVIEPYKIILMNRFSLDEYLIYTHVSNDIGTKNGKKTKEDFT